MTQATSFDEIPYDWLKPGTYVEVRPVYDRLGLTAFPARALIVAQMLPAGSAQPGRPVQVTRDEQGAALCGPGSVGDQMVRAFRAANRTGELWLAALPDADEAARASGMVELAGAPAEAGQVTLYVAGRRVRVVVRSTDTPDALAAALAAAVNADAGLPVTARARAARVTLTARHGGEVGNGLDLRLAIRPDEALPPGLTATVTPMAGGAGNPDLATVLAAIAGEWFTDLVLPWTDGANLAAAVEEARDRYGAMGRRDVHLHAHLDGGFGQLTARGDATDSPFLTHTGLKRSPSPPWAIAASLAGVAMSALTDDPSRQLRGLALPGILPPAPEDRFSEAEQELLLRHGISTMSVLRDGTVTLDRVVTTRKTGSLGTPDRAWLDIMVPKTLTRIRHDWASHVSLMYPRHKLAADGSPAALASDVVVTPRQMHGTWAGRCKLYERLGWVDEASRTIADSSFRISESDRNRMEGRQRIRIMGNLMVLAAALEFEA